MTKLFLTAPLLTLLWAFSPDGLVLLGKAVGGAGLGFLVILPLGLLVSLAASSLLHRPAVVGHPEERFKRTSTTLGMLPAISITIANQVCLVFFLPVGMLVTSGFTFNETFVYWFPNFGFSFILLGLVTSLHLAGRRIAEGAQPLFIGLALLGLLVLIAAGLFKTPPAMQTAVPESTQLYDGIGALALFVLLFLGYDQLQNDADTRLFAATLIIAALLLLLWGYVSLKFVGQAKLIDSTIPYVQAARKILGQPGRVLIGITIISGTCGMVNGLYLLATRTLTNMGEQLFPSMMGHREKIQRRMPLVFTIAIGMGLTGGLAGSENIDTYIYGALLLWLVHAGLQCLAVTCRLRQLDHRVHPLFLGVTALLPAAALYLIWTHDRWQVLATFCILACAFAGLAGSILMLMHKRRYADAVQSDKGVKR